MDTTPSGLQVRSDLAQRLFGEQIALEPERRLPREHGERVRDGEQDEVVPSIGVVEEGTTILDVHGHPRVLVRMVRVEVTSQSIDQRVDLDGVHVRRPLGESDGDVVAAARADDQDIGEWILRRTHVRLEPELLVGRHVRHRHDPLVGPAVHADPDAAVDADRRRRDAVVRRPVGHRREREHSQDQQRDRERDELQDARSAQHPHEDHGDDDPPCEGRRLKERERGERQDPQDAAKDVESIGLERFEAAERAPHPLGDRGHRRERQDEDDGQGDPRRQRRPSEPADQL